MGIHPDRVHIVPVRYEFDRVLEPIREHGGDIVYLLYDELPDGRPQYYDELESELETMGLAPGESLHTVPCDHSDPYEIFGLVTTIAADHSGASVGVNLATGSKLAAIGAALGCMDAETNADPYFPHAERYVHDGMHSPVAVGYEGDTRLIDYPIESPSRDQLAMLAVIAIEQRGTATPKKRTLIERALELTLSHDCSLRLAIDIVEATDGITIEKVNIDWSEDFTSGEKVSAYSRLDTNVVRPLETREYLSTDDAGRSVSLALTETGEKTLQAFRHKLPHVIEALDDMYPRRESPGAQLPGWLEPTPP